MKPYLPFLALVLTACPDPEPQKNPPQLWLALMGSETRVQLVPVEPEPF